MTEVMNVGRLLPLLGSSSDDLAVVDMLRAFGARKYRPALDEDDLERMTDWFPVREAGIEFGFEDEAYLKALDPMLRRKGKLIFHEVIFYGEHETMSRFEGELPFGLSFPDSRGAAQAKMNRLECPWRSHVRDVWELPDYRVIVSYSADDTRLVDMIVCLRDATWPQADDWSPPLPAIQSIVALLGDSPTSRRFINVFRPFGILYFAHQADNNGVIDVRTEFGFELHFASVTDTEPGVAGPRTVLNSVTMYRDRDVDARGWKGELPFQISMNDSPPVVLAKVGRPPANQFEDRLNGTFLWHFATCSLHIVYSTLDNLVYRVTLARPGAFQD